MGGCCCGSKRTELDRSPTYFCYPISEESEPLSAHHAAVLSLSTGLLVDTNLDTSVPDTYRAPPVPLPYETCGGAPHIPLSHPENPGNKNELPLQTTSTELAEDTNSSNSLETKLKNMECDEKSEINIELVASKDMEYENLDELKKTSESFVPRLQEEEEVCPTCLEEYDSENPKIMTKCDHHFHLACILEWMERSDTCPVCDQEMAFSPAVGE